MKLPASYFDGKSSRRHPVALRVVGRELCIEGSDFAQRRPLAEVVVGACLDGGLVTLRMTDSSACEVPAGYVVAFMIAQAERRSPVRVPSRARWLTALAGLVLLAGLARQLI